MAGDVVKQIRRATRRKFGAEEKIRIVLEGLCGVVPITELCRRGGIAHNLYYRWSKAFIDAGKNGLVRCQASPASVLLGHSVFIVSNELTYSEVMERLLDSETSIGRPINPTIYNVDQIEKKLKQDNAFVSRVMEQPKIWIKEDEDVYRTIRQSG